MGENGETRKSKKLKMWQIILFSLAIATALTLGYLAFESIFVGTAGIPPIHRQQWGGDCREEIGLFWSVTFLEPMTGQDEPAPAVHDIRNFHAPMLFLSILVLFAVSWIVLSLINGKKKAVFITIGAVAACFLVFFVGKKIRKKINSTPEKLMKIEIYTTDIQPDHYFAVEYPQKAYYLVKAGEDGKFGRTETEKLEYKVNREDVTKEQLNEILAAVRKVKENSVTDSSKDFAYIVTVQYEKKKGYSTVTAYGYGGYPEGWDDLIRLTNNLCGGDYLSHTPEVEPLTDQWFSENFGIYEEDLPDGVTVDNFIKSQRIEMKMLCGYRNHWTFDAGKYYEGYMNEAAGESE